MIARCLRPDTLIDGFIKLVNDNLGAEYLESQPANIINAYQDATNMTQLFSF
jgi:hypothetical protein